MAEFPALPLFTDAYLGDTTHLTTFEHGAYLLLLMAAWRSKDGLLPDDDIMLARYARISLDKWKKIKSVIKPFFHEDNKGAIYQKRIQDERCRISKIAEANRASGKLCAFKIKGRHSTNVPFSFQRNVNEIQPPIPIPIPTLKKDIPNGISKENKFSRQKLEADDLTGMTDWFKANAPDIKPLEIRSELLDWCDAKGKIYKDYYAALRIWAKSAQSKLGVTNGRKASGNTSSYGKSIPIPAGNGFGGTKSQTQLAHEITEQIKRDRRARWEADNPEHKTTSPENDSGMLGKSRPVIRPAIANLHDAEKIR